jgi:hypothetical protein
MSNHPATIFDPEKTKKLLYRQEQKLAKFHRNDALLIDSTSAIFLQNLIESSSSTKEDGNKYVTLEKIQNTISSNPSFQFLEDATMGIKNDSTQSEYAAKKSKRSSSTAHTKLVDRNWKIVKSECQKHANAEDETVEAVIPGVVARSDAVAPMFTNRIDKVVPDEDDYD